MVGQTTQAAIKGFKGQKYCWADSLAKDVGHLILFFFFLFNASRIGKLNRTMESSEQETLLQRDSGQTGSLQHLRAECLRLHPCCLEKGEPAREPQALNAGCCLGKGLRCSWTRKAEDSKEGLCRLMVQSSSTQTAPLAYALSRQWKA